MTTVRLGIIGCGVISRCHVDGAKASPLLKAVACTDLNPQAARKLATEAGIPTVYPDARALLADPKVDAVVLAMPTAGRADLAHQAFAAGKHVLIEKPPAMHADELQRLIAARGDRVAAVCSSRLRLLRSAVKATEVIASGRLGELRLLRARSIEPAGPPPTADHDPPAWRLRRDLNGGGILVNWGVYDLDYLLGLCGWKLTPRTALAQAWPVPAQFTNRVAAGSDAESHFAALVRFDGGTVLTIERGEFIAAHQERTWQIIGERASLRLNMTPAQTNRVFLDESDNELGVVTEVIYEGDEDTAIGHYATIHDFAEAIIEDRPPQTTLENALVIQKITDAIYASSGSDCAVPID